MWMLGRNVVEDAVFLNLLSVILVVQSLFSGFDLCFVCFSVSTYIFALGEVTMHCIFVFDERIMMIQFSTGRNH